LVNGFRAKEKARPGGRALVSSDLSLYFQNIKLAGVNRQSFEVYIVLAFSELRVIASFHPLDKISGEVTGAPFKPDFGLSGEFISAERHTHANNLPLKISTSEVRHPASHDALELRAVSIFFHGAD
jgi:hypothetical protein